MELFYKNAAEEVAKHNGTITNLSAYSQSGVPGVKIGAKYKVPQITTFVDWGGIGALNSGVFTKSELEYINSHTHSYSDSGKDLTSFDGGGGKLCMERFLQQKVLMVSILLGEIMLQSFSI